MTDAKETPTQEPLSVVQMASDFQAALMVENDRGERPPDETEFFPLRLASESLDLVTIRHHPQDLAADGYVRPGHLVRSYVEGEITGPMTLPIVQYLLAAVTGANEKRARGNGAAFLSGLMDRRILPAGSNIHSILDAVPRPLRSFSMVRRFVDEPVWTAYAGLKMTELELGVDAVAGGRFRGRWIGRHRTTRAGVSVEALSPLPAIGLVPGSTHVTIRPEGAVAPFGNEKLLLTGWQLRLLRSGMRPIFSLGTDGPRLISDGLLAISGGMTILANASALAVVAELSGPSALMVIQFRLDDGAGGAVIFDLPRVRITAHHLGVSGAAQPAQLRLQFEAEPPSQSQPSLRVAFTDAPAEERV